MPPEEILKTPPTADLASSGVPAGPAPARPAIPGADPPGCLEELSHAVFETNQAIKLVIDPRSGAVKFANQAAVDFYGYPRSDLLHKAIFDLNLDPEPETRANMASALAGRTLPFHFRHRLANGEVREVEVFSGPVTVGEQVWLYSIIFDVTDCRKTREDLAIGREQMALAREAAGMVPWSLDPASGAFTWFLPLPSLFGPNLADHPQSLAELGRLVHPDDQARLAELGRLTFGQAATFRAELRVRKPGGEEGWLYLAGRRLAPSLGAVERIIGLVQDVTLRKNTEIALKESEERYRFLAENTGDVLYRLRYDSMTYDYLGPGISRLTGYQVEEINALGFHRLVRFITDPSGRPLDRKHLVKRRLSGDTREFAADYLIKAKDGQEVWLSDHSMPWFDEAGRLLGSAGILSDITDRKRAQEELARTKSLLQAAIEQTPAGILMADQASRLFLANTAALEMRFAPLRGPVTPEVSRWRLLHPDGTPFAPDDLPLFAATQRGTVIRNQEAILEGTEGEQRWILGNAAPVTDPTGRIVAGVAVFSDITEARAMQKALVDVQWSYRRLLDNANEGVAIIQDGRMVLTNPRLAEISGYTSEELKARPFLELVHAEDRDEVWERQIQAVGEETPAAAYEFRLRTREGGMRWLLVNHLSVEWEGRPAALSFFSDITSRKLAEEALRASEEKYRVTFQASPDGIAVVDPVTWTFLEVNDGFCQLTQLAREAVLGRTPSQAGILLSEEDKAVILRGLSTRGMVSGLEVPFQNTRGVSRHTLFSCRTFDYQGQPCLVAVVHDVSELKKAQEEKRLLTERLQQAQKLEAIGTLAGGVAHDFNNLLQIISGHIQFLSRASVLSDAPGRHVQKIQKTIDRAAKLVRQLLTFGRKLQPVFRPLNLNAQLHDTLELLRLTLPPEVRLRFDLAEDLWQVNGDPGQLEQVMMNLVTNARDALPQGGVVTLSTKNILVRPGENPPVAELAPGQWVRLTVADNGVGMDEETRRQLFEPFFTTKALGRGTGLGLAMVYGILETHGGGITCQSRPGQGAVFQIHLPALTGVAPVEPSAVASGLPDIRGGRETVLLVDDEKEIVAALATSLQEWGYQVLPAYSGEEGLEIFRTSWPHIDLVILDLGMPGMGGLACLAGMRELNPAARVIIASGFSAAAHQAARREIQANCFVEKPYRLGEMLRAVRRTLDAEDC
ncbi:MAG: PAS domain S-box protein [Deltaproteobacteria bacterium]|nr:PAS domain S-box protein [Deltaproteobacteria bacterium]